MKKVVCVFNFMDPTQFHFAQQSSQISAFIQPSFASNFNVDQACYVFEEA